ncbi:MAG TPA: 23S rRNA (uracil(1939)-C(5))-methyltransferase RlmD [Lachnospiraceae bacterium]|nr:23S rRNA (uracil(1939)-C(5))-methyltransferase RlmD [Lachnospiraceae bacterium]
MRKGQVYEGFVERVDFPNKGIVKMGEDTCIVKNSLPGQKISFSVNKLKKGKAEGRLLKVIEKSPLESEVPCSHFGVCGGCTYLSLSYEEQINVKDKQVKKILDQALAGKSADYMWEGIKKSPRIYEYRNKMEFSFGDERKDGPLSLGMHKRGSFYDIVTVDDCMLVDIDYRSILHAVLTYFSERSVTFYHRMTHEGFLRHLLVRKASHTGQMLIALITTSQYPLQEYLLDGFCRAVKDVSLKNSEIKGILHIVNDSIADVVKSDATHILFGQDYFYEELLGLRFRISPFSFFQTNSAGAEVLYQTVREYIGELGADKIVFDLYSGTGTIAQLMAPVAKKVIGVEIVEEAVEAARQNAIMNGLKNCEFIAGDVLKVLDQVTEKPDLIILDPPRDGIHPKALPMIIQYGVERIVYISCKPTSLARDLQVFTENGYMVEKAVAVDQFPWTANVETLALLVKESVVN